MPLFSFGIGICKSRMISFCDSITRSAINCSKGLSSLWAFSRSSMYSCLSTGGITASRYPSCISAVFIILFFFKSKTKYIISDIHFQNKRSIVNSISESNRDVNVASNLQSSSFLCLQGLSQITSHQNSRNPLSIILSPSQSLRHFLYVLSRWKR